MELSIRVVNGHAKFRNSRFCLVLMTLENHKMSSTFEVQLFVTLIGEKKKKFKVE